MKMTETEMVLRRVGPFSWRRMIYASPRALMTILYRTLVPGLARTHQIDQVERRRYPGRMSIQILTEPLTAAMEDPCITNEDDRRTDVRAA